MSTSELDIALFQSITSLISDQRRAQRKDRRDNERRPFRCVQLIAPFVDQFLPDLEDFRQVMCHDLSPGGFSFMCRHAPASHQLIVILGKIPDIRFFVAEIARINHVETSKGKEFLVGCRFVRRLE